MAYYEEHNFKLKRTHSFHHHDLQTLKTLAADSLSRHFRLSQARRSLITLNKKTFPCEICYEERVPVESMCFLEGCGH
jgi:hypothetical protein